MVTGIEVVVMGIEMGGVVRDEVGIGSVTEVEKGSVVDVEMGSVMDVEKGCEIGEL